MEFAILCLILFSIFLTAAVMVAFRVSATLMYQVSETTKIEEQRTKQINHLANLLASKDPLAFQQISTVTIEPETRYTGPYLSGDDIELLEIQEKELEERWIRLAEDLENGNG